MICAGPLKSQGGGRGLMYNEYVIYDTSNVFLRYLVKVKFETSYSRSNASSSALFGGQQVAVAMQYANSYVASKKTKKQKGLTQQPIQQPTQQPPQTAPIYLPYPYVSTNIAGPSATAPLSNNAVSLFSIPSTQANQSQGPDQPTTSNTSSTSRKRLSATGSNDAKKQTKNGDDSTAKRIPQDLERFQKTLLAQ